MKEVPPCSGKTISGFSRMGLLPVQPTLPWSGLITISSKDCQSMPRLSGSPHSLDLNPIDFYLWEYLKDHAYENSPKTMTELKQANQRFWQNGGHMEHILQCIVEVVMIIADFLKLLFFTIVIFSNFYSCLVFLSVVFGHKDIKLWKTHQTVQTRHTRLKK